MTSKTKQVGVRFSEDDLSLLKSVCEARRENTSTFIRRAVFAEIAKLSYLPKEQKKALGVG
jgi:uncharacterized protein (DUF1778 family)